MIIIVLKHHYLWLNYEYFIELFQSKLKIRRIKRTTASTIFFYILTYFLHFFIPKLITTFVKQYISYTLL